MSIEAMDAFVSDQGRTGVLVVRYENIVENPKGEIGRLLEYIGLNEKVQPGSPADVIRSIETVEPAKFDLLIAPAHESAKHQFAQYMKLNGY